MSDDQKKGPTMRAQLILRKPPEPDRMVTITIGPTHPPMADAEPVLASGDQLFDGSGQMFRVVTVTVNEDKTQSLHLAQLQRQQPVKIEVTHLILDWSDNCLTDSRDAALVTVFVDPTGLRTTIRLLDKERKRHFFTTPCHVGGYVGEYEKPERWGLRRLGPGVWTVLPSMVVPGAFHAFVTLINVPEPAPFATFENPSVPASPGS